jgi:hypothetical protein
MVFNGVLKTAEEKYNQIVRLIRGMNIDYQSDLLAFRQIARA